MLLFLLVLVLSCAEVLADIPQGWDFWIWELDAQADVFREQENVLEGESALGIRNPTGTVSVVKEGVRIDKHRPLSFRGWVRTALTAGPRANLALIFFDADGNFLGQEESRALGGQNQWTRLEVTLREGEYLQAEYATVMCSISGAGQGTAWFDDLRLEQANPYRRLNLPGGGFEEWGVQKTLLQLPQTFRHSISLESRLQYTPHSKWQSRDRVRMDMSAGYRSGFFNVWLQVVGVDRTGYFYDQRNVSPSLRIRTFEISGNGNIIGQQVPLRIGRMRLNYSPYLLTMTDDHRDQYQFKHGLSIEKLDIPKVGQVDLFGFNHSATQLIFGGRYTFTWNKLKASSIYYRLANTSLKAQQEYYLVSLSCPLPTSQTVTVDWAIQNRDLTAGNKASMLMSKFDGKLSAPLSYSFRYYDFAPAFDPPYRDRTPQYDTNTMSITAWNPVDRYKGKQGWGLTLKSSDKRLNATLEYDLYQEAGGRKDRGFGDFRTSLGDYNLQAGYLVKGEWNRNLYDLLGYYLHYSRWNISLTRNLKLPLPITAGLSYESEEFRSQEKKVATLFGQYRFSGALNGMQLRVGIEQNNQPELGWRKFMRLNWNLPNQISILWSIYDKPQPGTGFDPVSERYYDHESLFLVYLRASFS